MSNAELATAARETRITVALNAIAELSSDLDNVNHRLSAIKGRLLGQFDECSAPINKEVEPDRSVIDDLDYRLRMLNEQIVRVNGHIAVLEEL